MRIVPALALLVAAAGAPVAADDPPAAAPLLHWRLVRELPHDRAAFTEGLVVDGKGRLLESSGGYGRSTLAWRDLASGRVLKQVALEARYFGEGAAVAGDRIVQLTWKEGTGLVYDLNLKPTGQFHFNGDGWGLAWDGEHKRLVESDGTDVLYFMDPGSYEDTGHVSVRDGGEPVYQLNELEVAKERILANVWHSDRIAVIAPDTGAVLNWIDLAALEQKIVKTPDWDPSDNVLNGIAYDARSGHFYVTGKRWPKLFEIAVERFGP